MTDQEYDLILNHFNKLNFCGNVSDPTMHPRFIEFLEKAQTKDVQISTATTHRSFTWYKRAFKAHPKAKWIFGMDGLPDFSPFYRINQDGDKMWEIMKLAKEYSINTIWQYLIFGYNKHQVEEAKEMAADYNIELWLMKSKRIDPDVDVF